MNPLAEYDPIPWYDPTIEDILLPNWDRSRGMRLQARDEEENYFYVLLNAVRPNYRYMAMLEAGLTNG